MNESHQRVAKNAAGGLKVTNQTNPNIFAATAIFTFPSEQRLETKIARLGARNGEVGFIRS